MRRILEFLPLLLALALLAGWFGFQQPLPWLQQGQPPSAQALQPLAAPTPTTQIAVAAPRATVLLSLCDASHPRFLGTLSTLKDRLGAEMGDATDCERPTDTEGDTQQVTSTGLAYYRRNLNLAAFTNGYDHWALNNGKLVKWQGDEVEPPSNASAVD